MSMCQHQSRSFPWAVMWSVVYIAGCGVELLSEVLHCLACQRGLSVVRHHGKLGMRYFGSHVMRYCGIYWLFRSRSSVVMPWRTISRMEVSAAAAACLSCLRRDSGT